MAIAFASALFAVTLDEASSLLHVAAMLALQGIGFALFSSPNMAIVMNAVPAERRSIASALAAQARSLGMLAGMLITAASISLYIGDQPLGHAPHAFVRTMTTAFSILAALSLWALGLGWRSARRAAQRDTR